MVVKLSRLHHAVPLRLRVSRTANMLGKYALCRPANMLGKDNGALFSLRPGLNTGSRYTPPTKARRQRSARFQGFLTACAMAVRFVGADSFHNFGIPSGRKKASLAS